MYTRRSTGCLGMNVLAVTLLVGLTGSVVADEGVPWKLGETECTHSGIFAHPTDCLQAFICPSAGVPVLETFICTDKAIEDEFPVGCLDKCPYRRPRAPKKIKGGPRRDRDSDIHQLGKTKVSKGKTST